MSSDPTPSSIDQVEADIAALRERVRALAVTPAKSVTPSPTPSPHDVFAQKLRETQGQWFTVEA